MPESEIELVAGRYRLDRVLGHGGMGQVWEAHDEMLARRVAVKEVRWPVGIPDAERAALLERTLREARLTARLNHRGVVTIYDVVSHDGRPFIVMELLAAMSLADAVAAHGALPAARVAEIGLEILSALDAAHSQGVIHRDVKPSNVLLRSGGRVVLTDFGIASSDSDATLTTTGLLVGSPSYMSPERLRGGGIGPPADMWSLGVTLYAALNGATPFRADNVMGTITAVLTDPTPEPGVQGPLRDAILGLLDKDPAVRLTSDQARPILESAARAPDPVQSTSTLAPAVQPTETRSETSSRRSRRLPLLATAVLLLAGVLFAATRLGDGGGADDGGSVTPAEQTTDDEPTLDEPTSAGEESTPADDETTPSDDETTSSDDETTTSGTVPIPFESASLYEFARYLFDAEECFEPEPGQFPVSEIEPDIELVKCESDEVPYTGTFWCKDTVQDLRADRRVYLGYAVDGTQEPVTEPPAGQDEVADGIQVAFNHTGGNAGRVYWDSPALLCAGELQASDEDDVDLTVDYWLDGRST